MQITGNKVARKDFVALIEENVRLLDRLADKMRGRPTALSAFSHQQIAIIVRMHLRGSARLKDISSREHISTANLCAIFRRLEKDGLIARAVDESDRRNTWYSLTDVGTRIANTAMEEFRDGIEKIFLDINKEDEKKLIVSMTSINELLKKIEGQNEKN